MKQNKKKKGFTLVELLIVIGISGVLMAMAAPKYQGMVDKAAQMEQRSHARDALSYIDIYNVENVAKIDEGIDLTAVQNTINDATFKKTITNTKLSLDTTVGALRKFAEEGTPTLTSTVE